MPLVASLKTAGDTLRNMMELSNWFLLLPTNLTLFLQSEKGKRCFTRERHLGETLQSESTNPPGQWGKLLGGELTLLTGLPPTFWSSLAAPKEGTPEVLGGFSGLGDFERCLGVPENSSGGARYSCQLRVQLYTNP